MEKRLVWQLGFDTPVALRGHVGGFQRSDVKQFYFLKGKYLCRAWAAGSRRVHYSPSQPSQQHLDLRVVELIIPYRFSFVFKFFFYIHPSIFNTSCSCTHGCGSQFLVYCHDIIHKVIYFVRISTIFLTTVCQLKAERAAR